MKKRGRESLSPPLQDSKKVNHTNGLRVESPSIKDGLKKSKLSMKQGSLDWSTERVAGPITKDEEEVVETLYALAGMFPDDDGHDKSKLKTTPSEAKLPALPDSMESPTPAIEVAEEDTRSTDPLRTCESTNPSSNVDNSVKETAGVDSSNKPHVQEQSNLDGGKNLHGESESCVPQVNLHSMISSLSETEHNADKSSCNAVNFHPLPELNRDSQLKQASRKDTSLLDKKSELVFGAATIESQLVQEMVMEPRNKGSGLWPGLSPMVLHDVGSHVSSLKSSAAKVPAWLDATLGASKPSPLENGFSIGKVSDGASTRRSLKRCAAHVHICRLIQNVKTAESKDKSPVQPDLLRTAHEGQKLLAVNEFDRVKNGFNGIMLGNNIGSSTSGRNLSEVRNTILQHKRLLEGHQHNAAATQPNALQMQSFDFLSLSTGGGGAEAANSANRNGDHVIAPSSQFQEPYLHSFPQHQRFMTLPMSQTRYPSSAYPDQRSTSTLASSQQVQLQLPQYLGPTRKSLFAPEQQQQQHPHQHQQQLWAAHVAAQYRPAGASAAVNQLPNWVSGRHDPGLLDHKYAPVSQQQPQLVTVGSSFPPTRVKRQEVEGGFWTSSAFPLQLLCNERL